MIRTEGPSSFVADPEGAPVELNVNVRSARGSSQVRVEVNGRRHVTYRNYEVDPLQVAALIAWLLRECSLGVATVEEFHDTVEAVEGIL